MESLGNLCQFLNGGTPSKSQAHFFEGEIPWITSADITGPIVTSARTFITEHAISASSTTRVPAGTVLLVTRTGVGKVAITGMDLCFSQDITALILDSARIDSGYLVHFLRTKQDYFLRMSRGATIKGVTRDVVSKLELPLPSLPEQRRIAAILDKADALRVKRGESLVQLDHLAQSIFLDVFGDPATNPKKWPVTKIGNLLESASYGTSEKSKVSGQFAVLRMNNITRTGDMDLTDLKYMDLNPSEYERYLVRAGDVLFNRTNSAELVGKTAVYRGMEPMAYAGYLIRLRTNADNDPEYLAAFLNTPYTKRILRNMCKSIIGMANINATEVQGIKIAQPPLSEQVKFRRRVSSLIQLKTNYQVMLAELDGLFSSLQQQAFSGEL